MRFYAERLLYLTVSLIVLTALFSGTAFVRVSAKLGIAAAEEAVVPPSKRPSTHRADPPRKKRKRNEGEAVRMLSQDRNCLKQRCKQLPVLHRYSCALAKLVENVLADSM